MSIFEVIILAVTQAITEFIPVSSSGHLIAVQEIGNVDSTLGLDVMLHFGTLIALVVYFWPDIKKIVSNLVNRKDNYLLIRMIISTIPAALAGFFFEDVFSEDVRSLGVVIVMLSSVGVLMIIADKLFSASHLKEKEMTKTEALFIGMGQALALIPGTSRSGITMLAARSQGLTNKATAHYSFLIGIPIIFGATLKVLLEQDTRDYIADNSVQTIVGVVVAAVVGWFVLRVLLAYVAKKGLALFGWYRLALASILFIIWLNK